MGKIIATYLVKVTLREPDDLEEGREVFAPPTIDRLIEGVEEGIGSLDGTIRETDGPRWYEINATAERTDI